MMHFPFSNYTHSCEGETKIKIIPDKRSLGGFMCGSLQSNERTMRTWSNLVQRLIKTLTFQQIHAGQINFRRNTKTLASTLEDFHR